MKRSWLDILLDKIKELGEDPKTLQIDGDLKNIHQNVTEYDDDTYSNIYIDVVAYTKNYVYFDECCEKDSYQQIKVIPRNPTTSVWNYEEIINSKDV